MTPRRPEVRRGHPRQGGVVVLGAGRLGLHLAALLDRAGHRPVSLWNRGPLDVQRRTLLDTLGGGASSVALSTGKLPRAAVQGADIVLLAVSDHALEAMAARLVDEIGEVGCPVVHCSGAFPGNVLEPLVRSGTPVGSMHPLRSFAYGSPVQDLSGTWFALEGDTACVEAAQDLVSSLGGTSVVMASRAKTVYHAAAVMSSNLLVALVSLATELVECELGETVPEGTVLKMFLPLVRGTVENLERVGLPGALTGPVSRGDHVTVARHLTALASMAREGSREEVRSELADTTHEHRGVAAPHSGMRGQPIPTEGTDPAVVYRGLSFQAVSLAAREGLPEAVCRELRALLTGD